MRLLISVAIDTDNAKVNAKIPECRDQLAKLMMDEGFDAVEITGENSFIAAMEMDNENLRDEFKEYPSDA